jgi:PAS domain S-box-containing protein
MNPVDRIRILIVENEGVVGFDIASTLKAQGYLIIGTCKSGEEALQVVRVQQPDLVLMDISLAGNMDGVETAKAIQAISSAAIVYVTACADLKTVSRARETQPHGYLLKPFSQDELRLTVEVAATRYLEETQRNRREHSYFAAFQALADGVIITDLAGVVVFVNPAAQRVIGWEAAEVVGHSLHEVFRVFHPTGEPAEIQVVDEAGEGQQRVVWLTTKTGERVPIHDRTTALRDQQNSLTGIIILFRRLAVPQQQAAPTAEQPAQAAPTVATTAAHMPTTALNSAAAANGATVGTAAQTATAQVPTVDEPVIQPQPHIQPNTAAIAPEPSPSPQPSAAQSPAPLVDVVETISDPLIALDAHWRLTYANSAAAKLLEREKISLMGVSFWDMMPSAMRDEHYETLSRALLHREALSRDIYLEAKQIWLELRAYPFGEGLLLLLKDTTARHEEAEKRNRMDRLESLGLLARGFAHDFNNLLTVLLGNISLAEMRLRGNTDKLPELATAKQATQQAQNLVQQLLTFARGGAPIKRQMKPGDLIEGFLQHHSRASNVNYRVEIQPGLPSLAIDPGQIRRLLGNVIRNAEQAMPRGGELLIRCVAPDLQEMYGSDGGQDFNDSPHGIVLEVRDTGMGIHPDHLPHIFEPYFSTRKAENATGLGLTVCESIAKAHGGSISIRSEMGRGTVVRFYLPVDTDDDVLDELGMSRVMEAPPVTDSPRILILEDDPLVRSLITRNLSTNGFEVTETAEGTETIRRYQESMDQGRIFDLVVLDLTIPNGLGGVRTMERLRQMHPEVVAIVSSGYSDDPVMAKPSAYGFSAVLPKPYEPSDLVRLVKSVLSARSLRAKS